MIRNIQGTILSKEPFAAVVDVQGIGYLVHTPSSLEDCEIGGDIVFHTHLAVRENALDLYGFRSPDELSMFSLLISLPKIGPKSALLIMSQADVPLLQKAALSGDATYLSKISGIGKKSAEKIVAGLRDKFGAEDVVHAEGTEQDHDVIDALITLGYSQKEASAALRSIPPDLVETNARIKAALKQLGR